MIKASSIYESVISIAVIAITVSIATVIISNIMSSQQDISYYQMVEKVEELKNNCIENQEFTNQNLQLKHYQIDQSVTNYKKQNNLKLVKFIVKKDHKKIKVFQYLIQKK